MNATFYISFWKFNLLFCSIFFVFTNSYATSSSGKIIDSTESINSQIGTGSDDTKLNKNIGGDTGTYRTGGLDADITKNEEEEEEEQKLKQDINTYIIESYKAQGSKIIKDLSIKLTKSIPAKDDRQQAYKKIRSSLEIRLEKTGKLKMSETKKLILKEFLGHMIDLLDKKIEELA